MRLNRRAFLLSGAAPLLAQARNRYSICSETFAGMNIAAACKAARHIGYSGIEIEPAHLSADPVSLTQAQRKQIRNVVEGEGLTCVGLHSFLKTPAGLHLTAPDAAVRRRSWEYFARTVDLAADLGDKPIMVLGSSRQRALVDGTTKTEGIERLQDGLRGLSANANARGVCILMEPLAPNLCNLVNTLAEAMEIVHAVASPAVQTIFDTHNTAAEIKPLDELIREYLRWIRHVHLNEMDGKRPGAGEFPFGQVLAALRHSGYKGWLSVEVFDFKPDGETVARSAYDYLQTVENRL